MCIRDRGKTVVQNGWKAIEEMFKASLKTKEKDDPMKSLPEVHEGDVLDNVSASVTEHFTTPPKQYTEDTLLSAMELSLIHIYYALRDYGMEAQIGRETTPKEYISRLTEVFTEVRRCLLYTSRCV